LGYDAFVPASVFFPEDTSGTARTVHPAQLPASIPARRASGAAQASPAKQAAAGIAKTAIEGNRRRMKRPCERVLFRFLLIF
jgi:hypothetical protein